MKILTNRIGFQRGGINRRVNELTRYFNSHPGNELVVVGMSDRMPLGTIDSNRVRTYWLTYYDWQRVCLSTDQSAMFDHLRTFSDFKNFVSATVSEMEMVIEKEKPDACFVQGAFYFPWCLAIAAKEKNLPVAMLYGGSSQTEIFDEKQRKAYLDIEKEIALIPKQIIFNMHAGRDFIKKCLDNELQNSTVIYNGIPLEFYGIAPVPQKIVLGWVGRNTVVKRVEYLLEIRKFISASEVPILALIPLEQRDPLRIEFKQAGIDILLPVGPDEMGSYYSKISTLISTSSFEFFANVVFEALAAGRVPIASKTLGLSELFARFGLGDLMIDLADPQAVALLIKKSRQYLDALSGLRKYMADNYSWDKVIEQYLAVVRSVYS